MSRATFLALAAAALLPRAAPAQLPDERDLVRRLAALLREESPALDGFRDLFAKAERGEGSFAEAGAALCGYFDSRWPLDGPPGTPSERARQVTGESMKHLFRAGAISHQFGERVDWDLGVDYEWRVTLNRLGFLSYMGIIYRHDRDERVAEEMEKLLRSWIEDCPLPARQGPRYASWQKWPPAVGINWRSLDAAIRIGNLRYAFQNLAGSPSVRLATRLLILLSLWQHIDYLKDDDWDGGNWMSLSSEAVATAGLEWDMFRDAPLWRAAARDQVERNILRDLFPDGKEAEDSTGYMQFALNHLIPSYQRLRAAGVEFAAGSRERMEKCLDLTAWAVFPDGHCAMVGDSDDGTAYVPIKYWRELGRPDVGFLVTSGREGTTPAEASRLWPHGGWAVLRSPFGARPFEQDLHLLFKASPGGPHGHLDQLAITAYAYGRPLLIDPGRLNYREEGQRVFAATSSHNTIEVDGMSQKRGPARIDRFEPGLFQDLVEGSHELYPGVVHRRTVVFLKDLGWLVVDSLAGARGIGAAHRFTQAWHFRDGLEPRLDGGQVIADSPGGPGIAIIQLADGGAAESGGAFDCEIAYEWDKKTPARGWRFERQGTEATFVTLLVPIPNGRPPGAAASASRTGGVLQAKIAIGARRWKVEVAADRPVKCRVDRADF
jgi:heparinase II/III-like protein